MEEQEKILQSLLRAASVDEMTEIAAANGLDVSRETLEELYGKVKMAMSEQGELDDDALDSVNGGVGIFGFGTSWLDNLARFFAERLFGQTAHTPAVTVLPAGGGTTGAVRTMEQRGVSTARPVTMEGKGGVFGGVTTMEMRSKRGKSKPTIL